MPRRLDGAKVACYSPLSMSLAVVTGSPGWLGTSLVEALAKGATFRAIKTAPRRVRCIVQPGVATAPVEQFGAEIVHADLRDPRALEGACRGATTVFHAAGIIHPKRVQDLYDINVTGTKNLLEEAIASRVSRFVLVSSNSPAGASSAKRPWLPERAVRRKASASRRRLTSAPPTGTPPESTTSPHTDAAAGAAIPAPPPSPAITVLPPSRTRQAANAGTN